MDFLFLLQSYIFELLNNNIILSKHVNGVYSYIPESALFPYVHLTGISADNLKLMLCDGYDLEVVIRAFSDATSSKPCFNILSTIRNLIENYCFKIKGWSASKIKVTKFSVAQNKHDLVWQGDIRAKLYLLTSNA